MPSLHALASPVHVVGAGGIGCAVGYALTAAGVPVTFVEADEEKLARGRENGVALLGKPPLRARFIAFAEWQPDEASLVLLCTKCYDNAKVLQRLPARVLLLPIQNGFDATLDARDHPLEGIASFVSECLPGQPTTRITRRGDLHLGFRRTEAGNDPGATAVLDWLVLVLRQHSLGFRVRRVTDVVPFKYTKLMYNAAISPLAAAAGLDNGDLLRLSLARTLFFALLRENHTILRNAGMPLGKVGPLHPDTVARILRRPWLARALAWVFYPSLRGTYCSMSGDLPRGRTEIDNYTGHLLDCAGTTPCPLNRRVYALVKRLERERATPRREWLNELLEDTSAAEQRAG
jgi:2-dehydropantoate 2-reductase